MVNMADYVKVDLVCTYIPCGHTGQTEYVHRYKQFDLETRKCPKCGLFTFTPVTPWGLFKQTEEV